MWMVLCVRNPRTTARDGDKYHEEELRDDPLHTVLKNSYSLFRLFNGNNINVPGADFRLKFRQGKWRLPRQ